MVQFENRRFLQISWFNHQLVKYPGALNCFHLVAVLGGLSLDSPLGFPWGSGSFMKFLILLHSRNLQ